MYALSTFPFSNFFFKESSYIMYIFSLIFCPVLFVSFPFLSPFLSIVSLFSLISLSHSLYFSFHFLFTLSFFSYLSLLFFHLFFPSFFLLCLPFPSISVLFSFFHSEFFLLLCCLSFFSNIVLSFFPSFHLTLFLFVSKINIFTLNSRIEGSELRINFMPHSKNLKPNSYIFFRLTSEIGDFEIHSFMLHFLIMPFG